MMTITEAPRFGAPVGIVLIVDESHKLIGIVTDGDIRRALVRDVNIDSPVNQIMVRDPITVPKGLSEIEMLEMVTQKAMVSKRLDDVKVNHVIIADGEGRVEDVIDFLDLWKNLHMKYRTVCVVGLGFVGLTLGITIADIGTKVYGYDIKENLVKSINEGIAPFYEKGLAPLLKFHTSKKNFQAVSSLTEGLADVYIITTGTPINSQCDPDLTDLQTAAQQVASCLKKRDMVLLRSTVPVGTTRQTVLPLLESGSGLKGGEDFYVAFAPERTIEGKALEELRLLPQIIGGINKRSLDVAANFFSSINKTLIRVASLEAAEMVKLANNSFRDLSFAFSNEFTLVCDKLGLDAVSIIEAANEGYPRNRIPLPSPGVGGACLRKDPYLYFASALSQKIEARLPYFSRKINESMIDHVFAKVNTFVGKYKKGMPDVKIFLIGFAFKGDPETSDIRDSSTVELVKLIQRKKGWALYGYDPIVPRSEIERLEIIAASLVEGFRDADCALIMNNHRSYLDMDVLGLSATMRKKAYVFDGWHLFPKEEIERVEGIVYGGLSGSA